MYLRVRVPVTSHLGINAIHLSTFDVSLLLRSSSGVRLETGGERGCNVLRSKTESSPFHYEVGPIYSQRKTE